MAKKKYRIRVIGVNKKPTDLSISDIVENQPKGGFRKILDKIRSQNK